MSASVRERRGGHRLGLHRVLDKKFRLPQAAKCLDNSLPIFSNEILVQVDYLNIDAASFVQMEKTTGGNEKAIGRLVLENSRKFGKQQNQETGSGGMLIGRVVHVGSRYDGACSFKVGDSIATLVSLTLTPLHIDEILGVDRATHQIKIRGHAILFESGIAAKLPAGIPDRVAMAAFDVAGAPATVNAVARKGETVVVIGGGGKAGILSCVAARLRVGPRGRVYAVEPFERAAKDLMRLRVCDAVWRIDATDAVGVSARVERATCGKMADLVVNVASVADTELSAILSSGPRGTIILFSMATSFSRATLGAEGVASRATLLLGNGYFPGHDRFAIRLLRSSPALLRLFVKRYGG